ncbi:MAG: hypothetical protein M3Y72_09185, partial [Acidobacteriota bacterium]|nr:hypothetical protein [Acidobacteriota bacterium]
MARFALLWAIAFPLAAFQYPGQVPPGQVPPGQYPPGQYPGGPLGGGGVSLPSRGHKKKDKDKDKSQQPTIEAEGMTLSNDGKKLLVGTKDGRTLTMTIAPETKWVRAGNNIAASQIIPRTIVHVVAAEDDQAFLTAVNVELVKDAPVEQPEEARGQQGQGRAASNASGDDDEMARPTILKAPDDPGRPVLTRGIPKHTNSPDDGSEPETAAKSTPAKTSETAGAQTKAKTDDSIDFTLDKSTETSK